MNMKLVVLLLVLALLTFSCGKTEAPQPVEQKEVQAKEESMGVIKNFEKIETVKSLVGKFAPIEIAYDDSNLSENQKKALQLMVEAAGYMDKIFLRQVYAKNEEIAAELASGAKPEYKDLKDYFDIHFGPFDRLEHNKPFINLGEAKPKGANYYPADMTKEEFDAHIKANPADEKAFTSEFTIIRRQDGKLVAVPYSEAYKDLLEPAAAKLKEAAALIDNPSLKKYLVSRADAFLSNDYYQSDVDWVLLKDHDIEIVIGPYEVYEDELNGYKAAFESFITLVDKEDGKKLAKLADFLVDMEKHLPIEDKHKNFTRGKMSPILVANEVYTSGDTKSGTQTIAFNLPNDERVRESHGSKKVMLKNICEAKFKGTWMPVAKVALSEQDLALCRFEAFFNHILMHEIAHGLGPGNIVKDGKNTSVGKELSELYSKIEEIKADVLGMYQFQYMIDKGVFDKELEKHMYITYLGGIFRSVRLGVMEAHGASNCVQLNYIMEKGGFVYDEQTEKYGVDMDKIQPALKALATDVLMIEALGDYDGAKAFLEKYHKVTPQLQKLLDKVVDVPNDIKPVYAVEKTLK